MALLDYAPYEEVRAALGVSQDELEDATLSLSVYEFNLLNELDEADVGIIPAFEDLKDTPVEDLDPAPRKFFMAARLFAVYATARQLLTSMPMFSPREISDGKATQVRFLDPYKETIKRVENEYAKNRDRMLAAFAALNASTPTVTTARVFFASAPSTTDPVTGS